MEHRMFSSALYTYLTGVVLSAVVLTLSPPDWASLKSLSPLLLPLLGGLLYGLGTMIGRSIGSRFFPEYTGAKLTLRQRWQKWRRRRIEQRKHPLGLGD